MTSNRQFRKDKPKAVSGVLEKTLNLLHLSKKLEQYAAFPHWPEIVGSEIARVAFPEKLVRSRVLVVRVLDSSWAQELSLRKTDLLRRIQDFPLGAAVDDIRFVTGDPTAFD